jgi:hypothetical protein
MPHRQTFLSSKNARYETSIVPLIWPYGQVSVRYILGKDRRERGTWALIKNSTTVFVFVSRPLEKIMSKTEET